METSGIRKKLWNSLDMRYAQQWGVLGIIGYAVMLLADLTVMGAIIFLPCLGYSWWRRWKIPRKAEAYEFHRAKLVQPQMQNYVNQTVTLACNPETEMVVVIG